MVTQTLSVILFSEQKLTHVTNISCEIQQNVELIKHLSKQIRKKQKGKTKHLPFVRTEHEWIFKQLLFKGEYINALSSKYCI